MDIQLWSVSWARRTDQQEKPDMSTTKKTHFASRFRFGLPKTITAEDKGYFVRFCLAVYCREEQKTKDTLSKYFTNNFQNFIAKDFTIADSDDRRKLTDLFRDRLFLCPEKKKLSWYWIQSTPSWEKTNQRQATSPKTSVLMKIKLPKSLPRLKSKLVCKNFSTKKRRFWRKHGQRIRTCLTLLRFTVLPTSNSLIQHKPALTGNVSCFEERWNQADLSDGDGQRAFSITLCREARKFYLDSLRP